MSHGSAHEKCHVTWVPRHPLSFLCLNSFECVLAYWVQLIAHSKLHARFYSRLALEFVRDACELVGLTTNDAWTHNVRESPLFLVVTKLKRVKSALKEWRQSQVPLQARIQAAQLQLEDYNVRRVSTDHGNLHLIKLENQLGLLLRSI